MEKEIDFDNEDIEAMEDKTQKKISYHEVCLLNTNSPLLSASPFCVTKTKRIIIIFTNEKLIFSSIFFLES